MTDSPAKSRAPPPFTITAQTQLEDWKKWQKSYRCYANAVNLNQKSHDVQLSTFKSLIGLDALEIYHTFSILDTTDVESVIEKFDEHFKPKVNLTLERYKLYRLSQKSGQHFDDFLADVTNQVDRCEFKSMKDEIILYKIVGGIEDEDARKALLADENLKFDTAVQLCRASTKRHFISGKENVSQDSLVKKKEKLRKTSRSSLLGSTKKEQVENHSLSASKRDEQLGETPKIALKPSEIVETRCEDEQKLSCGNKIKFHTRSRAKKPRNERFSRKISSEKIVASKEILKQSNNEDPPDSPVESSEDGRDSDWRADDHVDDDDDDDDEHGSVAAKRQPAVTLDKVKNFPCDICGKELTQRRALKRHAMIHVQENFICHHCGGKYRLKYYLLRHMVRAHAEIMGAAPKVYTCDVCEYKTTVGPNMRRHKFQHTDEKPFACQLCDYKCIVRQLMKAHMAKHTGERPFACDVCHKGFTESGALKKHMVKHMSPEEKERHRVAHIKRSVEAGSRDSRSDEANSCETCGKVFCSKPALKAHSVIHTGEKPFACNVCDYRSAHRSALVTHMNTKHSADKPFVCSVCGYACKLKSALLCHMNTHSGDRPFACKLCDSKFKQSAHLSVHMRVHTGEKPFVCDICGHRWANQSNLRQHMKIHQNQSRDPNQYSPPRKRKKKHKNMEPIEPLLDPAQWAEQVSSINPMECFPGLETPSTFHPPYPGHQGNSRPPGADCRFFEQRQWPNQSQSLSQNPNNTKPVAIMSSTQLSS